MKCYWCVGVYKVQNHLRNNGSKSTKNKDLSTTLLGTLGSLDIGNISNNPCSKPAITSLTKQPSLTVDIIFDETKCPNEGNSPKEKPEANEW